LQNTDRSEIFYLSSTIKVQHRLFQKSIHRNWQILSNTCVPKNDKAAFKAAFNTDHHLAKNQHRQSQRPQGSNLTSS